MFKVLLYLSFNLYLDFMLLIKIYHNSEEACERIAFAAEAMVSVVIHNHVHKFSHDVWKNRNSKEKSNRYEDPFSIAPGCEVS